MFKFLNLLLQARAASKCLKTTFPIWLSNYYEDKFYEDVLSVDVDYQGNVVAGGSIQDPGIDGTQCPTCSNAFIRLSKDGDGEVEWANIYKLNKVTGKSE